MSRQWAVTAALLALTVALAALLASGVDGAARTLVTVAFACTAPGWAITQALPGTRVSSLRVSVSVAASVAVDLVFGECLLLLGWHPTPALGILVAATGVALALHLVRPVLSGAPSNPAAPR